ncbi:MAG: hypothetical protein QM713_04235 [Arachnia sp.]
MAVTIVIALLGMQVLSPAIVSATNFSGATGSTDKCKVNMADNSLHTFWYESLTTASSSAVNWARTNIYNPTDIDTTNAAARTSSVDVIVHDAGYVGAWCGGVWYSNPGATNGWVGYVTCESLYGNTCEQHYLFFDTDYMGPQSTTNERSLACHELGHTIGLLHRNNQTGVTGGCMPSSVNGLTRLTDHDIAHITSNY